MEKLTLNVEGMSCQHCVKAVKDAVTALKGVSDVEVSLEANTVTLGYDAEAATLEKIRAAIEDQGYDVA